MDSTGGTRTGTLGTVIYAAPEIVERSHEATILADVYGLGMTAVFALSGADLSLDIFRQVEVVIDAIGTSNHIKHVLKKAIAWKEAERFPSVEVFCRALQNAIDTTPHVGVAPSSLGLEASPEIWAKSRQIFQAAIKVEAKDRTEYLVKTLGDDKQMLPFVEKLLDRFDRLAREFDVPGIEETEEQRLESMVGRRFGAYRLVSLLGAGGSAVAYLAERADEVYRTQVVIKLMRLRPEHRQVSSKFYAELPILTALEHPNIAQLLESGTTEDRILYFAAEFFEGYPIDTYCDRLGIPLEGRLELFRQLCSAIQFAHRYLVIHGDLRPSNVIVTSDGVLKVLDIGIVNVIASKNGSEGLTEEWLRPFGPYTSPEQVRGELLTTSTDIYSLGAILYELLTGKLPYGWKSDVVRTDFAYSILNNTPLLASSVVTHSSLRRQIAGDLDTIVTMALRKEPERRYISVQQLAEDIERYLGRLPVAARRDTLGYRSRKFVGRHKISVSLALLVILLLWGLSISIWLMGWHLAR